MPSLPKLLCRRYSNRGNLIKDSSSGHLIYRELPATFTLYSSSPVEKAGYYTIASLGKTREDGMSQLISSFNSASWGEVATRYWRGGDASWGNNHYQGFAEWWCTVTAAEYDTKGIEIQSGFLTHIASGSFICGEYNFSNAAGAGEARVAVISADSRNDLPSSLSELEALTYVTVTGTGRFGFPTSHFERHRYIYVIAYIAGLMPPIADCYNYDWNLGYPSASIINAEWGYNSYGGSISVTFETSEMAAAALSEQND